MSLLISSMVSCINIFHSFSWAMGLLTTTLIAPPSPGRSSVLTMCFPNEIVDYEGIDGVMSY